MANHLNVSTESDSSSKVLLTTAVTRRSLLGGAGIAVGAAVLASPPSMPGIAPAAAQPVSAEARSLDAAFKRRAFEVRGVCAGNDEKIPIAPHPTNGDEARYTNKIGSDSRGLPHDKRGEVEQAAWQALYSACLSGDPGDFERIPLGGTRKLVNPVGTLAVSLSGINPTQIGIPPAPALASAIPAPGRTLCRTVDQCPNSHRVAHQRIPDRIRRVAGDSERRSTETPAAVRRDTAIHNDRKGSRGVYPYWSCTWVGGSTDPCNTRWWGGRALLRDLSTGRARVLPLEPVSEIKDPGTCGCHLRLAIRAGTARHGDQ
jgi:hypothetical protein